VRPRMSDTASDRMRADEERRGDPAFRPRVGSRLPVRRAPSLARQLLQAVLLQPSIVRDIDMPSTGENSPDAFALAAVLKHCAHVPENPTTPGLMQAFAGTEHEATLASALAAAEDHDITPEQAATHLREGVERWRAQEEQRSIAALLATPLDQLTPEQREVLKHRMGTGRLPPKGSAA